MRILIVHNLLWAHYKSSVFQALQHLVDQRSDTVMKVLQIARNEQSRAALGAETDDTAPTYTYDYELLFDRYWEEISLRERTRALFQQATAFRPDVINLTGYYDPAQIMLLVWAKARGIRVIMQNESTEADQQRGGLKEQVKQWIFNRCDGFFCFGSQAADYLFQFGVSPGQILLRKNAVDNKTLLAAYEKALPGRRAEQQRLGLRPNNFIFVGRLAESKNLPLLLTCFAEARKQSVHEQEWGLILLGDGAERERLITLIDTLGLADSVKLLPGRSWYQIPAILALSNVLILPSRSEPWGLVVNEAMACGLPVIVSDRCGCAADLVQDDRNGFVFDPDVPDELTVHLTQFMDGLAPARQMGEAAQQFITQYSPEAVAQEMLDGFIKIAN